ncbi:hypothetical protein [Streptomyces sp. NPDC050264]|uniref:hypothetical protein n=1 Tax=Streptomyces sp. NPDC050264 TaxID=3155038 RepID=UPI0034457E7F
MTARSTQKVCTAAALRLAGGDARVADAAQILVDLNHMAPTFGATPRQSQKPVLSAELADFWKTYETDPRAAIERTPGVLRTGAPDQLFLRDADRRLTATERWGEALRQGRRRCPRSSPMTRGARRPHERPWTPPPTPSRTSPSTRPNTTGSAP